jgi:hypothetical protein
MLRRFMGNLQDTLVETIEKDYEDIQAIEDSKSQRKECNILLKRVETAKNLLGSNKDLLKKIIDIESKIKAAR